MNEMRKTSSPAGKSWFPRGSSQVPQGKGCGMELRKRSFSGEGGSEEGSPFSLGPRQGLRGPREYGTWASRESPSFLNETVHVNFPDLTPGGARAPLTARVPPAA